MIREATISIVATSDVKIHILGHDLESVIAECDLQPGRDLRFFSLDPLEGVDHAFIANGKAVCKVVEGSYKLKSLEA